MSSRTLVLIALLFTAAALSWYLARSKGDDPAKYVPLAPLDRGYYLTDARILGTDADGSLLYEIHAQRAEQQSDQRIKFSVVHIEYSPDSEVPWTIDADTALLSPDQRLVFLQGNVHATSSEGFSGDETEVFTASLRLQPDLFTAETDDRIDIKIGDRTLSGTGMLAFLKENRMELRSNVSGRFVP